jgi:hypothetical protein
MKLKTLNSKIIMTVHNENERRKEEVFKRKERHNKNLTKEVETDMWKYSMKAGKGE